MPISRNQKVKSVAGKIGDVTLNPADVNLNNIDNTADVAKPVSSAQATAIAAASQTATWGQITGTISNQLDLFTQLDQIDQDITYQRSQITNLITRVDGIDDIIGSLQAAPVNSIAPVISGTATVGATLTTTNGTWNNNPTTFTYAWLKAGVEIAGATNATYVVAGNDLGASISCRVTGTNSGGFATATSNSITIIAAPSNTGLPIISGTPSVGGTLSVSNGTWLYNPTFTYQWRRNGLAISGATNQTYIVQADDQGQQVSAAVTATNGAGSATSSSASASIAGVVSGSAPGYVGTGFSVIETPPTWDWSLTQMEPSRSAVTTSTEYHVGPGQTYAEPDDVPWLTLQPGDQVFIHHRPTPYKRIVFVGVRGAWDKWITIQGVKGANGERPVFDGDGAVLRSDAATHMGYNTQYLTNTAMFVIAKPQGVGVVNGYKPGYIHITGIEFRNCKQGYNFTSYNGANTGWSDFVAGIYAVPVEHLAITDCKFENNSMGVFINSLSLEPSQSRWILIRNNHFKGNGLTGQAHVHNAYTEGVGIIYEYNYFDSPVAGTAGDNIKERSAGNIFRYNYIRNGTNLISLRDPQSNGAHEDAQVDTQGVKLSNLSFIYSNIFLVDAGHFYGMQDIVLAHGDGSYGDGGQYRRGNVYFYRNRVICNMDYTPYQAESIPLFCPINTVSPTTFNVFNNLFYGKGKTLGTNAPPWALFGFQGAANFKQNWISAFVNTAWSSANGGLAVGTQFNGTGLNGLTASTADPEFTAFDAGDFSFKQTSPWHSLIEAYPAAITSRGLTPTAEPVNYPFNQIPLPQNSVLPSISGSQIAGNTLTATSGSWSGNPTYTYQWYKNGVAISGATSTTYITSTGDTGSSISVRVTATNVSGSAIASSSDVSILSATAPMNTALPVISGTATVDLIISVSTGTWTNSPVSYAYQWRRNGVNISGATNSSYTVVSADVSNVLTCAVTATTASAESNTATSTGVTAQNPSQDPDINGIFQFAAADGTTLESLNANWNGATTDYECRGGLLQCTPAGIWSGSVVYYENNQLSDQQVQVKRPGSAFNTAAGASFAVILRASSGQGGYVLNFFGSSYQLRRNGVWAYGNSMDINTWNSDVVVKMTAVGGNINVYINGNLLMNHVDPTPLTGGYPGLSLYPAGTASNMVISSWSDNAGATL